MLAWKQTPPVSLRSTDSPFCRCATSVPLFVTCGDISPRRGENLSRPGEVFPQRESLWHDGKVSGQTAKLAGALAPLGGAVAQRLRGFESAEPEKTVKRSSRRTGVNLQFFPVGAYFFGIVKGE